MMKTNLVFVKEKDVDFSKLRKEWEVAKIVNDCGMCSSCQSPVRFKAEICPYCGAEFGRFFDVGIGLR